MRVGNGKGRFGFRRRETDRGKDTEAARTAPTAAVLASSSAVPVTLGVRVVSASASTTTMSSETRECEENDRPESEISGIRFVETNAPE